MQKQDGLDLPTETYKNRKRRWIGRSVVILGGVTIGDNVIVGAGSVVTHDLETNGIYAGNSGVLIRRLPESN